MAILADAASARWQTERDGHTWYFCSAGCLQRFTADPDAYTGTGAHGWLGACSPGGMLAFRRKAFVGSNFALSPTRRLHCSAL